MTHPCTTRHASRTSIQLNSDHIRECSWPRLEEPFATALRHAVEFIFEEVEPVGIIASGTIIRGAAHRTSDLDVCVVHLGPFRRRIQRFFENVPAEIFINPPATIRAYFAEEDRDGRRVTAHMLATGVVVFQSDPVVEELRTEAARWLAKKTSLSDFERVSTRYTIASRLEDALDVLDTDAATATMLLSDAVLAMLEYLCKAQHGQIPRRKDLLAHVAIEHADVASRAVEFFGANEPALRGRLALEIADRTIGARGFFEWDSGEGPATTA